MSDKARQRALRNNGSVCVVSDYKPSAFDQYSVELKVHHLFDTNSRTDAAAYEENLIAVTSSIHRNFKKWTGENLCEPKNLIDFLMGNKMSNIN